ncbi:putative histone acetyltransferase subunit [Diaporthe ampelina]|uniref:Putative histone acetyltransferase subunit n=1 Tax=Diaporthe ampelina TaxID=1214573 RepID=A0A0G2FDR5_9PEZI|nr:putative histone acetyltransferase subunit [Diaporthe ampelina]
MSSLLRSPALTNLLGLANLSALGAATLYLGSLHGRNLEGHAEHEARMDGLEGTLRGHIGLIEDSLERLEGQKMRGMSERAQRLYMARGREEEGGGGGGKGGS